MAKKNMKQESAPSEPKQKRVRGVQINTKLVDFVAECVRKDTLSGTKADVIEAYQTAVNVKSPKNIDNIAKRNLRPAVVGNLQEALSQAGITYDDYVETQKLLVAKVKHQEKAE